MQFTQIQDKETLKITRYYLNGVRVKKSKYKEEESIKEMQGKWFTTFLTSRTQNGNFKHTKYSTI